MTRIILNGVGGRMGQALVELIASDPEAVVVAGVDPVDTRSYEFPLFKNITDCTAEADVVIDFSHPSALPGLLSFCEAKKLSLVLCTTGLSEELLADVKACSERIAVLRSGNMSLGINLLQKLVAEAARLLYPAGFDVEIVEKHHNKKLDAPSGTAIALADSVNNALNDELTYVYDRSQRRSARPHEELGLSSVRGGSIVGDHDVIFAGQDEVVTLSHMAYSRRIFAAGAVSAAKFLSGRTPGMYTMNEVVDWVLGNS